jgi:hypothetical protein
MNWKVMLLAAGCGLFGQAWANGYCDGRQTVESYQQCYRLVLDSRLKVLRQTFDKLMAHAANDEERASFVKYHNIWWNQVQAGCGTDLKCVENSINDRNPLLIGELRKRGGH